MPNLMRDVEGEMGVGEPDETAKMKEKRHRQRGGVRKCLGNLSERQGLNSSIPAPTSSPAKGLNNDLGPHGGSHSQGE